MLDKRDQIFVLRIHFGTDHLQNRVSTVINQICHHTQTFALQVDKSQ